MAQKRSADFGRQDVIENTPYNRHIIATYARRTAKKMERENRNLSVPILKESQMRFMTSEELVAYRRLLGEQYNLPEGKRVKPVKVTDVRYGWTTEYKPSFFDPFYSLYPTGHNSERNPLQPERTKREHKRRLKDYEERTKASTAAIKESEIKENILEDPSIQPIERSEEYIDAFNKGYTNIDDHAENTDAPYVENFPDYEEDSGAPYIENFPDYDTFDYDADSKIEPDEQSDAGGFSGTAQGKANVHPTSWYDDETGEITDEKGLNEWMAANIVIENARTVINQFKYYAGPDKSKKHQAEYRNNAYEVEFILDNAIEQMGARHVAMALQEMADNGQSINYEFFYKDKPNTDFYQSLTNALQATADANESLNDMLEADDWDGYDDGEDY